MKAIAAVSENWGIGKDNELLFHISEDMKNFRRVTTDSVVIMGRKTLESFPGGNPLPKRVNIAITRNPDFKKDGVLVVHSPEEAVAEGEKFGKEIFVIGGAEIYGQMLDKCSECIITKVSACPDADSYFPNLDENPDWEASAESEPAKDKDLEYKFVTYRRK